MAVSQPRHQRRVPGNRPIHTAIETINVGQKHGVRLIQQSEMATYPATRRIGLKTPNPDEDVHRVHLLSVHLFASKCYQNPGIFCRDLAANYSCICIY